jgi:putative transposase
MERYRITDDASVYFVTFSVVEWLPVFISDTPFRIVADSFRYCHEHKQLRINAYVLMPTHIHAIIFDAEWKSSRLRQTLVDLRRFTGRELVNWCVRSTPPCFAEVLSAHAGEDRDHRFWRPTSHPVALESEPFWRQKLDYLHENPCRKGLVRRGADWRFSSASWYLSEGKSENDVPLTRIDWS